MVCEMGKKRMVWRVPDNFNYKSYDFSHFLTSLVPYFYFIFTLLVMLLPRMG